MARLSRAKPRRPVTDRHRREQWRANLVRALHDLIDIRLSVLRAPRVLERLAEDADGQRSVLQWYGAYLVTAIRRQQDTGPNSRSLAATLLDMANHSSAARSCFGEYIDVHALREDRRTLQHVSAEIARFATHAFAHATEIRVEPLSFDMVHHAADAFRSIVQKYSALLFGVTLMDRGEELVPTWLAGERFEPMHPTLEEFARGQAFEAYDSKAKETSVESE